MEGSSGAWAEQRRAANGAASGGSPDWVSEVGS